MSITTDVDRVGLQAQAIRKVGRRLIPFLFLLYVFNYLDRINVGFAALSMNKDLALSATAFGLANSVFYVGYVACEIPSNLLLARYGARVWLTRIMVSWGLAASATMLVRGDTSLYAIRFLTGVLEAGFVPGVLLYMTFWFPDSHRARANGLLMMAQPAAMAMGAGVSGLILQHMNGTLGLQGWRWMFLIEGLPAVVLGLVAYVYLCDGPRQAQWLSPAEQATLAARLAEDRPLVETAHPSVWAQVFERRIVLLALAYFCLVNTLNATATWIPTIVREVMAAYSLSSVGLVAAIPPVCTLILMPVWMRSSDRRRERCWHLIAALGLAAAGWLLVILAPQPVLRLVGLMCTTSGAFSAMAVFWTIPQAMLPPLARPAGIGLISAVGILGSAVSPAVIGVLRDWTGSFNAGLYYVTALLVVSMALTWTVAGARMVTFAVQPRDA